MAISYMIKCPKCRAQKSGATKHGFKLFALTHGVKCDAKTFNVSSQLQLSDFVEGLEEE